MKELTQIIEAYDAAVRDNKKTVLATVVHIEGSSYRAPGARMLIMEDGMLTGAISGGCLEGNVLQKAMTVILEQKPLLVTYDTSDEGDVLGISLGCNGIIKILLEPVATGTVETPVSLIRHITDVRNSGILVTFFGSQRKQDGQGTYIAQSGDRQYLTDKPLPVAADILSDEIISAQNNKRSSFVSYPGETEAEKLTAFIEYVPPVPAIVIAGAGNDVFPVTQLAAILGWEVALVDGRPAYAKAERFPGCRVMRSRPEEALSKLDIDEETAILLMSHNYNFDKAILRHALSTPARYIGILGPRDKRVRLLNELRAEDVMINAQQEARVYGPTGLDIGAETSEEIALSIIAEIKKVFEDKTGDSLKEGMGPIHQRQQNTQSEQLYGILVLAAGLSKRLGTPKQKLLYDGQTLLQHAVRSAIATNATAIAIVVSKEVDHSQFNELDVDIVINAAPEEGMSGSIRAGMNHLKVHHPAINNVLIMLCDQPLVDHNHLNGLIEKHQNSNVSVVASRYAGRNGVPAVFSQIHFEALSDLRGDTGAKYIIESLGDDVGTIDFPQGVIDVDTQESYKQIIETQHK